MSSWTVVLENEKRIGIEYLSEELILNPENYSDLILLKYLDPYGDVVFNQIQVVDLLLDIESIKGDIGIEIYNELIELINKCTNESHLYISFCGD